VVGAALLAPGAAQAHDFVVTQSTDPAPDDVCDTNCTLRDAIDLSNTNGEDDTITFASTVTAAAAAKDADGTSKTTGDDHAETQTLSCVRFARLRSSLWA
jgi:hypothetical protein